jgi:hypothetical protein
MLAAVALTALMAPAAYAAQWFSFGPPEMDCSPDIGPPPANKGYRHYFRSMAACQRGLDKWNTATGIKPYKPDY